MATQLKPQRSLLEISTDALCLAVSTALRLAGPSHKVEATTPLPVDTSQLPEISLDQVSWHENSSDCWIVIYDRVYDVTPFLFEHPGGEDVILEYAGRDATFAFRGTGHTSHAWRALEKYIIGQLPLNERLFKNGSSKLFENAPYPNNLAVRAGG